MNWYIGQEIVCIKTHSQGIVKKGDIYTIQSLRKPECGCRIVLIDVGIIQPDKAQLHCAICNYISKAIDHENSIWWISSRIFVPLEYDKEAIEELIAITKPNLINK